MNSSAPDECRLASTAGQPETSTIPVFFPEAAQATHVAWTCYLPGGRAFAMVSHALQELWAHLSIPRRSLRVLRCEAWPQQIAAHPLRRRPAGRHRGRAHLRDLIAAALAAAPAARAAPVSPPDVVFLDGKFVTLDPKDAIAVEIASEWLDSTHESCDGVASRRTVSSGAKQE